MFVRGGGDACSSHAAAAYRFTLGASFADGNIQVRRLLCALPLPESNEYCFGRIAAEDRVIVLARDIRLTLPWSEPRNRVDVFNTYFFVTRNVSVQPGAKIREMRHREIFACERK